MHNNRETAQVKIVESQTALDPLNTTVLFDSCPLLSHEFLSAFEKTEAL